MYKRGSRVFINRLLSSLDLHLIYTGKGILREILRGILRKILKGDFKGN